MVEWLVLVLPVGCVLVAMFLTPVIAWTLIIVMLALAMRARSRRGLSLGMTYAVLIVWALVIVMGAAAVGAWP